MEPQMLSRFIIPILLLTMLPAANSLAEEVAATLMLFREQEPAIPEPYDSRMLLTADYLRMDDGIDDGDFALLDRNSETIYSVSHDDRRILVVPRRAIEIAAPQPFRHDVEELDAGGVPDVDGKPVRRYYLFTNGMRCLEIYSVEGFLEDARQALAQFAEILAGEHARTVHLTPEEYRQNCDLANNVFVPARHLDKGFPVRQKDFTGRSRYLVTTQDGVKVDSSLFELPTDYQRFMPGTISR
jgi:hypothetical protein